MNPSETDDIVKRRPKSKLKSSDLITDTEHEWLLETCTLSRDKILIDINHELKAEFGGHHYLAYLMHDEIDDSAFISGIQYLIKKWYIGCISNNIDYPREIR